MGSHAPDTTIGTGGTPPGRRPFVFAPFRAVRYNADTVGDLGTVISPPYDVLDAETVRDLESANRRNIVRLILSRHTEPPYAAVSERLQDWRAQSYLRADAIPGLYVYQYTAEQITVRGLIGLLGLRQERERVVLPHEDVMPGPVADRAALMRTTRSNLEPILLVHEGTARLRSLVEEASAGNPLAAFAALDGSEHRLWSITAPATLETLATELAPARALIADGHHRYAAYLQLQEECGPSGGTPWDFGLAFLVDQHDYPLRVGPIHRSIDALTMSDVVELSAQRGDTVCPEADREAALATFAENPDDDSTRFVLSDGRAWAVLRTRRTDPVDAAVLHGSVLPAWKIAEDQIGYHHSLDQALGTIARQPGIVVAVRPPSINKVMDSAAQGVRMPRKSTSFGPKPRMGVVMRDLRDH